jgi:hypothetical protein
VFVEARSASGDARRLSDEAWGLTEHRARSLT